MTFEMIATTVMEIWPAHILKAAPIRVPSWDSFDNYNGGPGSGWGVSMNPGDPRCYTVYSPGDAVMDYKNGETSVSFHFLGRRSPRK